MAEYEDAEGYVDASDAGLEVPPPPWQYDDGGSGGGGSSGFGGDVGAGDGSGQAEGEQPGDESSKSWVRNWTPPASSDSPGQPPSDFAAENPEAEFARAWSAVNPYPAGDWSSQRLGENPELVYYGAYQPASPYYGTYQFRAGADPYAMYTVAQMNENPELAYMPKPPLVPDIPKGLVTPRGRGGGGGARSYPSGPSIPPDALRAFVDMLRFGGIQRI